jgi:hypothetical protein
MDAAGGQDACRDGSILALFQEGIERCIAQNAEAGDQRVRSGAGSAAASERKKGHDGGDPARESWAQRGHPTAAGMRLRIPNRVSPVVLTMFPRVFGNVQRSQV